MLSLRILNSYENISEGTIVFWVLEPPNTYLSPKRVFRHTGFPLRWTVHSRGTLSAKGYGPIGCEAKRVRIDTV